ncbi:MAG: hypothetical protein IKQ90_10420, partial [Ruminococcus sp.]|nr:hypothetical protein [Ruminococcus sp.]
MKRQTHRLFALLMTLVITSFVLPLSAITAIAANDSYQNADVLALNTCISDSITSSSDENWYVFTTTKAG